MGAKMSEDTARRALTTLYKLWAEEHGVEIGEIKIERKEEPA